MNSALLHRDLESLRPALVRFALLQLRNPSTAEDVVQDTLVAVLEKPDSYAGRSSLRTYVTGILKHKIIDSLRSRQREVPLAPADGESDDDFIDALFRPDGHVIDMPRQWGDPDATLEQKDFFRVMEICLERLPPRMARIFIMREWLELDTDEICRELGISAANAWVILYRARVQLRECLDLNWFGRRP
ncbi:MAG TPA: sigma-70 family RNA polymerase sigma factor [Noviherbaspirillum sp.]|jgi:RNA polymerase sigma-70 factor (ECF subfamily)|uniref:sigma-70 family RNA polymerase sigma factor n=1 Tax=Noviherbaspirillum sp. TaxID=1926288 RepID=UPI002F94C837